MDSTHVPSLIDPAGLPSQARWIGSTEASSANLWLCFRRQLHMASAPAQLPVWIACDSKYWLWVNGQLVVREGQLKRGPTPTDTYCDRVDLAPHLRVGANQIAVLVWYFGRNGFSHNSSGRPGLFVAAVPPVPLLVTDGRWKVRRHPAFGNTEAPHPNFRLPESNIRFDAGADIPGWVEADYADGDWPWAVELGAPPAAPWGGLYERPILPWKDFGLRDYVAVSTESNADGTVTVIGKLPYNAQITPWLDVTAAAGQLLDIRTDDYLGGGPPNLRAEYITRAGRQQFEAFGWINGHEVRYSLPATVQVHAVKFRETGYDAEFAGRFECDNPRLNTLWEMARRTLYITMRDTYMDCPDRERAQWWGDAVNELGEAFYVFDAQKGPLLARKAIYELVRWQRPDKVLFSPVPAGIPGLGQENPEGNRNRELPPQMLASIGWYGFWTYYLYSGDQATIAAAYPAVREYLSLWQLDANGLAVHRPGDWDWTDWGENIDAAVTDSAWLYLALKGAIAMAELTSHGADCAGYRRVMDSIAANFNRVFWQGDKYRSPAYQGLTDDRANAMAVIAGLARPADYPVLRELLRDTQHASPYMEKYVLEALYLMQAPALAVERMLQRFGFEIDDPNLTTLYEGWGPGTKGYGGGTYNHAWSGGALTVLCQYAAGVAPLLPGFREFEVRPQMEPLQRIDLAVPTVFGSIELALRQDSNGFQMDLTVPAGTRAIVGLPQSMSASAQVSINNQPCQIGGASNKLPVGASCLGVDRGRQTYALAAGRWMLQAQ